MSLDRARFLALSLGSLLFGALSVWVVVSAPGLGAKFWGVLGVLLFGGGGIALTRDYLKGKPLPRRKTPRSRFDLLILPVCLLFTLPSPLKLWLAAPLIAAWALLFPRLSDRRMSIGVAIVAAVLAVAQALLFCMGLVGAIDAPHSTSDVVLYVVLLLMVLWFDARVLLEVRRRVQPARD